MPTLVLPLITGNPGTETVVAAWWRLWCYHPGDPRRATSWGCLVLPLVLSLSTGNYGMKRLVLPGATYSDTSSGCTSDYGKAWDGDLPGLPRATPGANSDGGKSWVGELLACLLLHTSGATLDAPSGAPSSYWSCLLLLLVLPQITGNAGIEAYWVCLVLPLVLALVLPLITEKPGWRPIGAAWCYFWC